MSDKSLIFTIGLTNVKDTDGIWTVESDSELPEYNTSYNLYKQHPDVEKASLSWKLNMHDPLIAKLIYQWEQTIRKPHLKMVSTQHKDFHFNKDYVNMFLDLEHIPLMPVDNSVSITNKELVELDLTLNNNVTWGALRINIDRIYDHNDAEYDSLQRQVDETHMNKKFAVKSYDVNSEKLLDIPLSFSFNLELSQMKRKVPVLTFQNLMHHQKSIFEENEQELIKLGYDKESYTKILTSEVIQVGEPVESSSVLYETFSKYPTVCRTSLTKEE